MRHFILGRTNLEISRTGFGALPIQRVSFEEADALLNRALDGGISYIDTARAYTDSEEKIGKAISHRRSEYILATKTGAQDAAGLQRDLEMSLRMLNTDCIDVYQFHNPPFVPRPGGADGLYDAAVKARAEGKIRFISITQHSIDRAFEAVESGLYDTVQYPFNHLATEREIELVRLCKAKNVGFICMKALSGGLITNAKLPFAWLSQFDNIVPIWGVQRMNELAVKAANGTMFEETKNGVLYENQSLPAGTVNDHISQQKEHRNRAEIPADHPHHHSHIGIGPAHHLMSEAILCVDAVDHRPLDIRML